MSQIIHRHSDWLGLRRRRSIFILIPTLCFLGYLSRTAAWSSVAPSAAALDGMSTPSLGNTSTSTNRAVYHSAHGQDRWIVDNLLAVASGEETAFTFVEAGSYDGLTGSNVATLERNYGFRGLCYEPNPRMFELVKRSRPMCEKFNAVICDTTQAAVGRTYKYTEVAAPHDQESGIIELMDDYKAQLVKKYKTVAEHEVSCRSLTHDIKTFFNGRLDLLSLDVEGAELIVLQTIDWTEICIGVIMAEISHEQETREFLIGKQYHLVARVGFDNVFIHSQSPFFQAYKTGCECKLHGECKHAKVYPDAGWINCDVQVYEAEGR